MAARKTYEVEAARLAKAIGLAIDAISRFPPDGFSTENTAHFIATYSDLKNQAVSPPPCYKNLRSLRYTEADVFIYFQEAAGAAVEYFWTQVALAELGYERRDLLRKILDRGKIKGRIEYEYAVDSLVAAQQQGRITPAEFEKLAAMIGQFESGKSN